jgi:copper chaperone
MDTQFKLPDMVCGGCAQSVTQALRQLDPQAQVQVDLPSQTVRVSSAQPREALAQALAGAGFAEAPTPT